MRVIAGRAVHTDFIFPPIPLRQFDWCAFFDEEEQPYGYGRTEEEAIADLQSHVDNGEYDV